MSLHPPTPLRASRRFINLNDIICGRYDIDLFLLKMPLEPFKTLSDVSRHVKIIECSNIYDFECEFGLLAGLQRLVHLSADRRRGHLVCDSVMELSDQSVARKSREEVKILERERILERVRVSDLLLARFGHDNLKRRLIGDAYSEEQIVLLGLLDRVRL